ncbi:MAG: DUF1273 family protein [Clostridia bacterium]|nr:DUF1273 family protein [Clostridia bacterium]
MITDRTKTCAFTGHRNLKSDFSAEKLKTVIKKLVCGGYDTFLIGMAIGFDTECFKILEEIRKNKPIKIIACIPCVSQDYKFSPEQKEKYAKMLNSADEKIYVSKEYTKTCMFKRNMFMVDNAGVLIAYLNSDYGGTYQTVNYAKRKNVDIIFINK